MTATFDLLLQGGDVVDAAAGLSGGLDIAIDGGVISAIGPGISPERAGRVVDVSGRIVTPGLIDMHAHVFEGVTDLSVNPDVAGVLSGVTTIVDAGSAGAGTFEAFPSVVMPANRTEIIPFIHLATNGMMTVPEIAALSDIDVDRTRRAIEQHRELIVGVKVRMVSPGIELFGTTLLRTAHDLAREAGVKLMVHVGDILQRGDPQLAREVFSLLDPGDIATHVFTSNPGGILDHAGKVFPEVVDAAARGVVFDAAHGRRNLSFDVVRRVLDQGVRIDTVSTDLTKQAYEATVFSMTELMSRYFAFGFTLPEIIAMSTTNPALAIGIADRSGRLEVGRRADISVLEVRTGTWMLRDFFGAEVPLSIALVPSLTVVGGQLVAPGPGPHPWGWEPESAQ